MSSFGSESAACTIALRRQRLGRREDQRLDNRLQLRARLRVRRVGGGSSPAPPVRRVDPAPLLVLAVEPSVDPASTSSIAPRFRVRVLLVLASAVGPSTSDAWLGLSCALNRLVGPGLALSLARSLSSASGRSSLSPCRQPAVSSSGRSSPSCRSSSATVCLRIANRMRGVRRPRALVDANRPEAARTGTPAPASIESSRAAPGT